MITVYAALLVNRRGVLIISLWKNDLIRVEMKIHKTVG